MKAKGVVVLGMHRSGTSALSGELSRLGVFMGKNLHGPKKGVNEKGFGENVSLVDLNEKILHSVGSSWHDPLFLIKSKRDISKFKSLGLSLIDSEYSDSLLWGMKDPRVSLLFDFWLDIFEESSSKLFFIHMIRDPREVAESLRVRNGFSYDYSFLLWIIYNYKISIKKHSIHCLTVDFSELISRNVAVSSEISEFLEVDTNEVLQSSSFIDKKLQNNKVSITQPLVGSNIENLALEIYKEIKTDNFPDYLFEKVDGLLEETIFSVNKIIVEYTDSLKENELFYESKLLNIYRSLPWRIYNKFKR
jgi:hypothetical protein|tara:strand:+ start:389 stop:1303 length:915 start_codon:yes stop_codon:yes gene_type:complete